MAPKLTGSRAPVPTSGEGAQVPPQTDASTWNAKRPGMGVSFLVVLFGGLERKDIDDVG